MILKWLKKIKGALFCQGLSGEVLLGLYNFVIEKHYGPIVNMCYPSFQSLDDIFPHIALNKAENVFIFSDSYGILFFGKGRGSFQRIIVYQSSQYYKDRPDKNSAIQMICVLDKLVISAWNDEELKNILDFLPGDFSR